MPKLDPQTVSALPANTFNPAEFITNSKSMGLRGEILIQGAPDSGKTVLAFTASKFWPKQLPSPVPVVLSDMIGVPVDAGAFDALALWNISVPTIEYDQIIGKFNIDSGLMRVCDVLAHHVSQHPECETAVIDTVTQIDRELVAFWEPRAKISQNTGEPDIQGVFRNILGSHKRFHSRMKNIFKRRIYNCHARPINDDPKNKQAKKNREVRGVAGSYDFEPDITGQARGVYVANASLEIACVRLPGPAGKGDTWEMYPLGGKGFEGKSRLSEVLPSRMESNLGLAFEMLENHIAKLNKGESAQ